MRITLLVSVAGIFAALSTASFTVAAESPQTRATEGELRAFKADGLTNNALITKIFEGDFVNIDLDRSDDRFGMLLQQYLEAFAHHCSEALPPNKVEMTRQECNSWDVYTNRFGVETRRTCTGNKTVRTGLYAKPALYDALNTVHRQRAADFGREMSRRLGDLTRPDAISKMVGLIGDAQVIANDMSSLVQMNACTALGLIRFEDNLRLFALNKQPIPLDGEAKTSAVISPPTGETDFRKLIEDLVLDDTKRWGAFARFIDGSVTSASVGERDQQGRPLRVIAPYLWEGMMGRKAGQVMLTFSDGQPECLTYSETASVCHSPNRRIIARYLEGGYSR